LTTNITLRLSDVNSRAAAAAVAAGRNPDDVAVIAVSKTVNRDCIRAVYDAGHRQFGENKMQELAKKAAHLPDDIEWHTIGHLQKNKVRLAVQHSDLIHSVDSVQLLRRIDTIAGELGKRQKILLQANVTGESTKHGVAEEALEDFLQTAIACANIDCLGLMTMAAFGASQQALESTFGTLRTCRDRLEKKFDILLPELSMGMSGDYEIAIAQGATLVRVGTAIFGARQV
jgi:pyridoxal phosphate enzyme (YggS family)